MNHWGARWFLDPKKWLIIFKIIDKNHFFSLSIRKDAGKENCVWCTMMCSESWEIFVRLFQSFFFSFQLSKHSLASFLKEHGKIIAQWASELHSRWAHSRATLAEQVPEAAKHKQHYTGNQNYTLEIELKQKHDLW